MVNGLYKLENIGFENIKRVSSGGLAHDVYVIERDRPVCYARFESLPKTGPRRIAKALSEGNAFISKEDFETHYNGRQKRKSG